MRELRQIQRTISPAVEVLHQLFKHLANVVGSLAQHAVQVDGRIGQVVLERQQTNHAVLIDIDLADFQESAVGAKHRQASCDGIAGQRIQYHVDSLPFGDVHDLVGKFKRPRVHDMGHTERPQDIRVSRRCPRSRRSPHRRPVRSGSPPSRHRPLRHGSRLARLLCRLATRLKA